MDVPTGKRLRGQVKCFFRARHFGFIISNCKEYFVTSKRIVNRNVKDNEIVLCPGQLVEFIADVDKQGRPQARRVKVISSPKKGTSHSRNTNVRDCQTDKGNSESSGSASESSSETEDDSQMEEVEQGRETGHQYVIASNEQRMNNSAEVGLSIVDTRQNGTIKRFNKNKGIGFIQNETYGMIFLHAKHCLALDHNKLKPGCVVEFDIGRGKTKGLQAINVNIVSPKMEEGSTRDLLNIKPIHNEMDVASTREEDEQTWIVRMKGDILPSNSSNTVADHLAHENAFAGEIRHRNSYSNVGRKNKVAVNDSSKPERETMADRASSDSVPVHAVAPMRSILETKRRIIGKVAGLPSASQRGDIICQRYGHVQFFEFSFINKADMQKVAINDEVVFDMEIYNNGEKSAKNISSALHFDIRNEPTFSEDPLRKNAGQLIGERKTNPSRAVKSESGDTLKRVVTQVYNNRSYKDGPNPLQGLQGLPRSSTAEVISSYKSTDKQPPLSRSSSTTSAGISTEPKSTRASAYQRSATLRSSLHSPDVTDYQITNPARVTSSRSEDASVRRSSLRSPPARPATPINPSASFTDDIDALASTYRSYLSLHDDPLSRDNRTDQSRNSVTKCLKTALRGTISRSPSFGQSGIILSPTFGSINLPFRSYNHIDKTKLKVGTKVIFDMVYSEEESEKTAVNISILPAPKPKKDSGCVVS